MPRSYHFHVATRLRAAAVGQPGQRTFYLLIGEGDTTVRVWTEKEQLAALGLAIQQVIESLDRESRRLTEEPASDRGPLAAPQEHFAEDFHVGRLAVGLDSTRGKLVIIAYRSDQDSLLPQPSEEQPVVQGWASPAAMKELSEEIAAVIAAGRPVCPLCGRPIDPDGHRCARKNGHDVSPLPDLDLV